MVNCKRKEFSIKGAPISRGIAIGTPFFFTFIEEDIPEFSIAEEDLEEEINRYRRAVERSQEEIRLLQSQLKQEQITEGAAILDAHLEIMSDPLLTKEIEDSIVKQLKNAEFVFYKTIKGYQKKFNSIADPFFRERFKDIQDISRRVLGFLCQSVRITLAEIPENSIVFAKDLIASDTVEVNEKSVNAFVTEEGGVTSHAAIVAKSKGIPYVTNIDFSKIDLMAGQTEIIVDGRLGEIIVNPSHETLTKYRGIQQEISLQLNQLKKTQELKPETYDGHVIGLSANVETLDELDFVHRYGGSGVGLFRSEYLFLSQGKFPSEEEQFVVYRGLAEKMKGLPVVIRTFDIGGDKVMSDIGKKEENPFLGCRAIRFLLKERTIFREQLCAILRATVFGNVRLMFPLVSTLVELQEAKQVIEEAKEVLQKRGEPYKEFLPVGCMIEVPSAAIISDLLAKECDFLSIGTNDLVQYALAVDRDNQAISELYTPTHPSVIRLIRLVISEANFYGVPVSVCGEVAADPRFTALLIGLGVHELSVASRAIPLIKRAVRHTSLVEAHALVEEVLSLSCAQEISELLINEYRRRVPSDSIYCDSSQPF